MSGGEFCVSGSLAHQPHHKCMACGGLSRACWSGCGMAVQAPRGTAPVGFACSPAGLSVGSVLSMGRMPSVAASCLPRPAPPTFQRCWGRPPRLPPAPDLQPRPKPTPSALAPKEAAGSREGLQGGGGGWNVPQGEGGAPREGVEAGKGRRGGDGGTGLGRPREIGTNRERQKKEKRRE